MPTSMPKYVWVCAAIVASAGLGCGTGDDRSDGGQSDANSHVCEGDRWSTGEVMKGPIADCTSITGDLTLTSNDPSIELPILARIDGSLSVWGNLLATHVAMPKLTKVGGRVDISYNDALTSLELPALATVNEHAVSTVWDLSISDNPLLPTCQANAIRDQLLAKGFDGSIGISGNLGACPP